MYSITNKGYGVLLCDAQIEELPDKYIPLVRSLLRRIVQEEPELSLEIEDIETDEGVRKELHLLTDGDDPWIFSAYSGDGASPVGIGFDLDSWASWELNDWVDRGVTRKGLITDARSRPTELEQAKWTARWRELTKPIAGILKEHGVTPGVFYTSSTS